MSSVTQESTFVSRNIQFLFCIPFNQPYPYKHHVFSFDTSPLNKYPSIAAAERENDYQMSEMPI